MKARRAGILYGVLGVLSTGLFATLIWMLWEFVPRASVRYGLLGVCCGIFLVAGLWIILQRRQIGYFADDVCETIDAAIAGRQPENFHPYDRIRKVDVREDMLNYRIELDTDDGLIALSAQQKSFNALRHSGTLSVGMSGFGSGVTSEGITKKDNWHRANLDATLEALKALNR